jgi:hypothetical protein
MNLPHLETSAMRPAETCGHVDHLSALLDCQLVAVGAGLSRCRKPRAEHGSVA